MIFDFDLETAAIKTLSLVQFQFFRVGQFHPSEFAPSSFNFTRGFFPVGAAGVIQQDKMRVAIKFLRVDAIRTSTNLMPEIFRPVSSKISRRNAASFVSPI